MPTYVFENKETGEVIELMMGISDRDKWLAKNSDTWKPVITAPNIVGGTVSARDNKDGGFNELMSRIGEANPGSKVAEKHIRRTAKQVKVDEVKKKHGF